MISRLGTALLLSLALTACGVQTLAPLARAATTVSAQQTKAGTITGDVRVIRQVKSDYLDQARDVWVYLPPGYTQSAQRYPVLYLHDGNNMFDATIAFGGNEWHADETAETLITQGELPPMILVGVGNTPSRLDEYTWVPGIRQGTQMGGLGKPYAQFLVRELKPMIDRTYRTRPEREHTGVLGSSLGGLESLYIGRYHSDVFGKIGAMSPSVWWADRAVLTEAPKFPKNLSIWLDMGWKEGDEPQEELDNARALNRALLARGYAQDKGLRYFEDKQGGHDEQAWAYRLPMALKFLFGR